MQVFLPYPSLQASVCCLDPKRLGNQVYREAMTLIRGGWRHHLASKMWAPYRDALAAYIFYGVRELDRRGYTYFDRPWYAEAMEIIQTRNTDLVLPPWLGDERIHSTHRAALLYKNEEYYSRYGWTEEPMGPDATGRFPYYWPSAT